MTLEGRVTDAGETAGDAGVTGAAAERRLALLVDAVEEYAIFMLDSAGRVVTWNAGAQRIKGYLAEEVIGKHFSIFYTAEDVRGDKPGRELADALRHGQCRDEGWRVRKDGSRFWANVVITALYAADGHVAGFAKVTRDETDRKLAEERIRILELLTERERIAEDLIQTIARRIIDVQLAIEGTASLICDPVVEGRLEAAVGLLDETLTKIRGVVFDLGTNES